VRKVDERQVIERADSPLHSQLYIPPPGPAPLGRADGQNQAVRIWPAGERRGEVRRVEESKVEESKVKERKVKVRKVKERKVKERKVKGRKGKGRKVLPRLYQSV
jgi:hypothetical protein